MKTFIQKLGAAAVLVFALSVGPIRAQDAPTNETAAPQGDSDVSFQTFYDELASQGSWINTDQYGYVFQPTESDPNWRPYTYGHWVDTDAGMTWVSDDSFGWATDHYGRWANIDGYGWVWVPGYTWAPAWVSWRSGDDEVGWAPLPPDSDEGIDYYNNDDYYTDAGIGFHIGDDCDVAYGIGPWYYNFCPIAYIGDRDCWRHFRDRRDNFASIGRTRNVTNINFRRDGAGRFGHVREGGPSVAALNARAQTHIQNAQLASASRIGDAGLRGNRLSVYAPHVNPATLHASHPNSVHDSIANVRVNRGTDINRPLAVNSHLTPAGANAEQVRAARTADGVASTNARIATANTHVSRPLTQPLTSLRTGTRAGSNEFGSNARASGDRSRFGGSGGSRFTGQAITAQGTRSSSGESRFTGEPATSRAFAPSQSAFRNAQSMPNSQAYHAPSTFETQRSFHYSSAPAFRQSVPMYHAQQSSQASAPSFHQSASMYHPQQSFHASAPAFRSQPSFHAAAPAPHFGGGAPAAHVSAGGGGHPSGGGAIHASAGGAGGRR
jgi:hypothetical protein